ncbi:MAG: hypothetical protein ABW202_19910 [Duganella sp.]
MKLTPAFNHTLCTVTPATAEQRSSSELLISDTPTGKLLEGVILEAALLWRGHLLLFITDDVPFEEGLHIYLLDQELNTLDSAYMVAPYSTGVFSNLVLEQENKVCFRFFEGIGYTLSLLPKESFALPFFSDPTSVWRSFKWKRWFRLDAQPAPDDETPSH